MDTLIWLLTIPVIVAFSSKYFFKHTISIQESILQVLLISIVIIGVWFIGKYVQLYDSEIWNGEILSKSRDHGTYVESYDCNCRQVCSGSGSSKSCYQKCDTCYRDHYTVTWSADTSVGSITFDHLDSTNMAVYLTPDPSVYKQCKKGQPASLEHSYINYVQALPESTFNVSSSNGQYLNYVPSYPKVYNFYRINRVLKTNGTKISSDLVQKLNENLNNELKTLGPKKQVNVIVIFTNIKDRAFIYDVLKKWNGSEKNDVVIVIGVHEEVINWSEVSTWTQHSTNAELRVKLRDDIEDLKDLNADLLTKIIVNNINSLYVRPEMKDFEIYEDSIEPPTWALILVIMLALGGSLGLTYVFHTHEVDIIGEIKYLFKRNKSR